MLKLLHLFGTVLCEGVLSLHPSSNSRVKRAPFRVERGEWSVVRKLGASPAPLQVASLYEIHGSRAHLPDCVFVATTDGASWSSLPFCKFCNGQEDDHIDISSRCDGMTL